MRARACAGADAGVSVGAGAEGASYRFAHSKCAATRQNDGAGVPTLGEEAPSSIGSMSGSGSKSAPTGSGERTRGVHGEVGNCRYLVELVLLPVVAPVICRDSRFMGRRMALAATTAAMSEVQRGVGLSGAGPRSRRVAASRRARS